jgi:hypothetical protein
MLRHDYRFSLSHRPANSFSSAQFTYSRIVIDYALRRYRRLQFSEIAAILGLPNVNPEEDVSFFDVPAWTGMKVKDQYVNFNRVLTFTETTWWIKHCLLPWDN